jgi:hypothetical protein
MVPLSVVFALMTLTCAFGFVMGVVWHHSQTPPGV